MIIPLVPYSLHLVDDGFFLAENLYYPDFSGSTRFFYFFDGGLRERISERHLSIKTVGMIQGLISFHGKKGCLKK